jgi:hypothetical protein
MDISLTELEAVINYWRIRRPSSGEECALSPEVSALADVYATMIFEQSTAVPLASLSPGAQQLITTGRSHSLPL